MAEKLDQDKVLIAEFMGAKYINDDPENFPDGYWVGEDLPEMLPFWWNYDSDWNWLMPVVEKIDQYAAVEIRPNLCTISRKFLAKKRHALEKGISLSEVEPIAEGSGGEFIDNVYEAVVKFIKWHTNQQLTQNDSI